MYTMYLCTYAYTIYDLYCQIWTTNESAEGQTSMNKINQWRERDIGREREIIVLTSKNRSYDFRHIFEVEQFQQT